MGYSFKVTAKKDIGDSREKIGKGMSVQVFEKSLGAPSLKSILEAFKNQQHGIELKGMSISVNYFTYEKL
ncbi:MAG: hypothetical protein JST52_07975 [Bacteroidetes bacterium]|nr:hypothetical protein [Bacteroidota bacterium]MBS1741013.1 hypothetical protein [Bacteroidota bacterium]